MGPRRLYTISRHVAGASGVDLPGKLGNPGLQLIDDPRLDPRIRASMIEQGSGVGALPSSGVATNADRAAWINQVEIGMDERPAKPPVPDEVEAMVTTSWFTITGVDGNEIELVMKRPKGSEGTALPCVYHTHGGGMVMMSMKDTSFQSLYTTLAAEGVCVIGVEFRNAAGGKVNDGMAPFPAGLNDCMSGLQYVYEHKATLNVTKIVCSGESGGGNLAIALALKAKQDDAPIVDGVFAMCPCEPAATVYVPLRTACT